MSELLKTEDISDSLVFLRDQYVLLDVDVARLYGVETRIVNQAVRNNPDKFPDGFFFTLTKEEVELSRSKFLILNNKPGRGHNIKYPPKAFTEKGLYMLATILKSPIATQTTLAIINTFAKTRELKRELIDLHREDIPAQKKSGKMKRFGEILADLVMPDLQTSETESSLELNFIIGKIKHKVKRVQSKQK